MCNNPVSFRSIQHKLYDKYRSYGNVTSYMDKIKIPCGNCLGCRLDSLALWTARCNYELYHNRSAFVTFTYDDYRLPYLDDTAILPSLCRDDLNHYLDNLRHKVRAMPVLPKGSRRDFHYFACGEYGGMFQRPHYHVLFFGLDFKDFQKLFYSSWKNGIIKSLPVLSGGVRYVIDYFTKEKVSGKLAEDKYDKTFRERPFTCCSRGLGSELFYFHRDEIRRGEDLKLGSRIIPVPLYYKNLYGNYSDDEICSRMKFNQQHLDDIRKESEKLGFSSSDSYLAYIQRANELNTYAKMKRQGVAAVPSYRELDKSFDTQIMARSALN